jgi:hypothetical protein
MPDILTAVTDKPDRPDITLPTVDNHTSNRLLLVARALSRAFILGRQA